jgi:hypothetical protein
LISSLGRCGGGLRVRVIGGRGMLQQQRTLGEDKRKNFYLMANEVFAPSIPNSNLRRLEAASKRILEGPFLPKSGVESDGREKRSPRYVLFGATYEFLNVLSACERPQNVPGLQDLYALFTQAGLDLQRSPGDSFELRNALPLLHALDSAIVRAAPELLNNKKPLKEWPDHITPDPALKIVENVIRIVARTPAEVVEDIFGFYSSINGRLKGPEAFLKFFRNYCSVGEGENTWHDIMPSARCIAEQRLTKVATVLGINENQATQRISWDSRQPIHDRLHRAVFLACDILYPDRRELPYRSRITSYWIHEERIRSSLPDTTDPMRLIIETAKAISPPEFNLYTYPY